MSKPKEVSGDLVAKNLKTPLACVDPDSWQVVYENARFFQLFPSSGDAEETLADRMEGLDLDKISTRLEKGRPYSQEIQVKSGARTSTFQVQFSKLEGAEEPVAVVECVDVSKQKEAEYMLDSYSKMSEKNARELQREKDRVEKLLLNVMPRSIYEELRDYGTTTPQKFDSVSVLMLDFAGFTEMAISKDAGSVVAELNDIFSAFDRIVELFNCERIKTIGDAYVAVCGLPDPNPDHAQSLARVALRMRRYLEKRNQSHPTTWSFRIGLATGQLVGSMVGIQKYVYDIFGPAVNLAARVEEVCEPMTITASESFRQEAGHAFVFKPLGEFELKGFGDIECYTLEFEAPN